MVKLWLNIKLWWWLNYEEIMKVGEGRSFGVLQESMMHIWVFWASWLLLFSMDGCVMMLSLKCHRSHGKVKKVFLNVQNIRTEKFNLPKSWRNNCKWVYLFNKKWTLKNIFFKILLIIFQRYCLLVATLILRDTSHSFSVNSRLHLTQLSNFVDSKLIKLSINALNY